MEIVFPNKNLKTLLGTLITEYSSSDDFKNSGKGKISYFSEKVTDEFEDSIENLNNPSRRLNDILEGNFTGIQINKKDHVWFKSLISLKGNKDFDFYFDNEKSEKVTIHESDTFNGSIITTEDVQNLYSNAVNSNIYIYSSEGFLEARDYGSELFSLLVDLINSNDGDNINEITYIFPEHGKSLNDWRTLKEKFNQCLSQDKTEFIKGYSLKDLPCLDFLKYLRVIFLIEKNDINFENSTLLFYLRLYDFSEAHQCTRLV